MSDLAASLRARRRARSGTRDHARSRTRRHREAPLDEERSAAEVKRRLEETRERLKREIPPA